VTRFRIPFNRPAPVGEEFRYIREAIDGGHTAGDGPFAQRCCRLLESSLKVERAMLTTSCTHALEICALLLDIRPGDEVIVPSFAFVTTAGAFALRGAKPVFVDVRPDTLNLDERALSEKITSRTRAIVVLHYGGVACEMDEIDKVSRETGVPIVEDNAHGLFGRYRGRDLGTFGCLATQSFHETKNFSCGEGGALLVNRADLIERAETIHAKGTNRSRFSRGLVDKYTWVDLGSSYSPSEILAAFLYGQLKERDRVQAQRARIWRRYREELSGWAADHGVGLPQVPPHSDHPSHLFYLILPSVASRARLIHHLARRDILAVFHYQPLHLSRMGRHYGGHPGQCPVTERVSERLLRLPLFWALTESEQTEVIEATRECDLR
jgi:dTDP-4-amino-4,6-dideoxygalactose transaminase